MAAKEPASHFNLSRKTKEYPQTAGAKRQMTRWTTTLFLTAVLASTVAHGQTDSIVINGTVFDKTNNEPLPLASVFTDSVTTYTFTDVDGNFSLKVPSNKTYILKIKYLGYYRNEIVLSNKTIRKKVKVYLQPVPQLFEPDMDEKMRQEKNK